MPKTFQEAIDFRHACKAFDVNKKISDADMRTILEAARKSPSSFGMEGWKFVVITNEALKAKLRPVCWDQEQITSCSHLVAVLAGIECLKPQSGIVKKRFERREMPQEKLDMYLNLYASHLAKTLESDANIYAWSARQTYIAAANMMTCAATLGIDSCPIEGFEKEKAEAILELDTAKYQIAMFLPLGYRINPQSTQLRLPFEEVVEFRE
ncbi:MAG: NAD(P)H-dependent oxidoreductase [Thiovulaceae bacterium]|jgi:nitroreductase|nr:NAD(P)H-dependent oxidoreductase [Sulfurimonadaceae bacterium]